MKRLLLPALMALALAGCASYSGIQTENVRLEATALGAKDIAAEWPKVDWWLALNDPTLNQLIDQALHSNLSLQEADVRLRKARAIAGIAESATLPQVDAGMSVTRERFTQNGLIPPPYAGSTYNQNALSINGSWELDFFGRNREALKAALGELHATEAEHQAARIMVAADVANNYFSLARLQQQQLISAALERQRSDLLKLATQRVEAGIDAPGDLEPIKSGVLENRRDTAAIDEQLAITRHALAALLGQGPEATASLQATLPAPEKMVLPEQIPLGLLGHRADIVAARWRVESGLHGMESAKAAFYPDVNLSAFFGFSSLGFNKFLDASSRTPGGSVAVSLPIFDAGRLRNQYRVVTAQTDGAIVNYNSTLVSAFREVADQLASLGAAEQQLRKQQAVLANAERSYALVQQRYTAGITGVLPVLNAEGALLSQQRALIDLEARWSIARVRLIHALGGGFVEGADSQATSTSASSTSPTSNHVTGNNGGQHG